MDATTAHYVTVTKYRALLVKERSEEDERHEYRVALVKTTHGDNKGVKRLRDARANSESVFFGDEGE